MLGLVMDEIKEEGIVNELNGNLSPLKDNTEQNKSFLESNLCPQNIDTVPPDLPIEGEVNTSIEQLYYNVCDMQSSDWSPSRPSLGSDGEESRIDLELCHLVGANMREIEIMEEEEVALAKPDNGCHSDSATTTKEILSPEKKSRVRGKSNKSMSLISSNSLQSKKASNAQLESENLSKSTPNTKGLPEKKSPIDKQIDKSSKNSSSAATPVKKPRNLPIRGVKLHNGTEGLDDPNLGPFLLKQARDLVSSGDNYHKALDLALRSAKSFEMCLDSKPSLELVMCLHMTASIYCSLGQYNEAIPVLEKSIGIPVILEGHDHALAKFAGHMQLGDTFAMLGQIENSILCYTTGLGVQRQVLGESDPRVGETCRYVAEAHVQALQFDEAEKLCQMALDIHRRNGSSPSLEEAADRRLIALICETKGDYEAALEHLVLASMAMVANGQETEVASVDYSIGDTYLSLGRYAEAAFSYQKALTVFKSSKGENHPAVASIFVRLADLYNRTGKLRDAKSYCENALRIYGKPNPGIPPEEIASGLTEVSSMYESMNELEQALELLEKALKIYNDAPGQQSMIVGIEAQMGVMYYMLGKYSESYTCFSNAVSKLRASGEKKSAFFGIVLNQMGLACVQLYAINEAADLFEESRSILEQECGPYHPNTLGVYSNLAGIYDAVGRSDDAIEILEYVVGAREEKLGTANPDVDDEKRRLAELLKERGRVRNKQSRSLETLLDAANPPISHVGITV